jgi:hypothetical protein
MAARAVAAALAGPEAILEHMVAILLRWQLAEQVVTLI